MVLEANIDDMAGELFPPLIEALLKAGARDAFLTPILGKKGRPGYCVTALCDSEMTEPVSVAMLQNSSTLGLRMRETARLTRERKHKHVATPWGGVSIKVGSFAGLANHFAPEFEDCRRCALAAKVPVKQVYEAALAAATKGEWTDA